MRPLQQPPDLPPPPKTGGFTVEEIEAAQQLPPLPQLPGNIDWNNLKEPASRSDRRPNLRRLPKVNYRIKRPYTARLALLDDRLMSFDQLRLCPFTNKPVVNLRACVPASRRMRRKSPTTSQEILNSVVIESSAPYTNKSSRYALWAADRKRLSEVI